MSAEAAVRVEGLRKQFGSGDASTLAVDDVSFEVPTGSSVAIVGESGSGKSTTARCLMGLEVPTSGRIWIEGRLRDGKSPSARERRRRASEIQMVFQDPYGSLNPTFTVQRTLRHALKSRRLKDSGQIELRVEELLELVELRPSLADAWPRSLSGGERQRVAIARALAADARILVLDEAVAALDVSSQAQILNLLADLREERALTLVFISHDLATVRQICDEVIVMRRGQVVESGRSEAVLDRPEAEYTQQLINSIPRPGWDPRQVEPTEGLVL